MAETGQRRRRRPLRRQQLALHHHERQQQAVPVARAHADEAGAAQHARRAGARCSGGRCAPAGRAPTAASVGRHVDDQPAARPQHAPQFGQRLRRVHRAVAQHIGGDRGIEAAVGERQRVDAAAHDRRAGLAGGAASGRLGPLHADSVAGPAAPRAARASSPPVPQPASSTRAVERRPARRRRRAMQGAVPPHVVLGRVHRAYSVAPSRPRNDRLLALRLPPSQGKDGTVNQGERAVG